jgi:hypothetical protein
LCLLYNNNNKKSFGIFSTIERRKKRKERKEKEKGRGSSPFVLASTISLEDELVHLEAHPVRSSKWEK